MSLNKRAVSELHSCKYVDEEYIFHFYLFISALGGSELCQADEQSQKGFIWTDRTSAFSFFPTKGTYKLEHIWCSQHETPISNESVPPAQLSHLRHCTLCSWPSLVCLFIHSPCAHCAAACVSSSPTQAHHGKNFLSISHIALPCCLVYLVCNDQWAQKNASKAKTKKTKMINWASPKSKATAAGALWRRPCAEWTLLWHRTETFAETWRRGVRIAALSPDSNTMSKNSSLLWLWRGGTSGYVATGKKNSTSIACGAALA